MRPRVDTRSGMTLIEIVIATGLATIVMTALFGLLDLTLDLWAKSESRRSVVEQATATGELLARDLRALHPGNQGDLWVDWQPFDVDGDGIIDRVWPRLRMVRQASRADLARLASAGIDPELVELARSQGLTVEDVLPEDYQLERPPTSGLMVVGYCVVPAGQGRDVRGEGVLMRGEEVLTSGRLPQIFERNFFSGDGQPRGGAMREVTGGVLWMGLQFATQTSVVWDTWKVGGQISDTSASWDAWALGRPSTDLSVWNEPGAGMPAPGDEALLPRRVQIELEFETERERKRRTRLVDGLTKGDTNFVVENGSAIPRKAGRHLLIEGEWMELIRVRGDRVHVRRARRATEATEHAPGALVHWGEPVTIEVPIPTYRDDWNISGGLR
jgi:type II secretory pathway pseudopilin PulG